MSSTPPSRKNIPTQQQPLGDVRGELRGTLANFWKSPALDFYVIAVIGGLLIVFGLVMVLSSSSVSNIAANNSPYKGFLSQALFALLGVIVLIVTMRFPLRILKDLRFSTAFLVFCIALQTLVITPLGVAAGGNRNWIKIGPVTGQPSEILKFALALWLGGFLAKNRFRLGERGVLGFALLATAVAVGSILLGKDLGTMIMVAFLAAGAFWVAGVSRKFFLAIGALASAFVLVMVFSSANRMARALSWIHGQCEGDSCFQSKNGLMALAEGGIFGVGLGQSKQKWGRVPEAENDYIFSIIGEEFGLVGTLILVVLFVVLAWALFRMMRRVDDPFVHIATAAITSWILFQAFVNMAVVTGLLPVLGVPLPFLSAGGSALLASMAALGLLLSFARTEPGAREALGASHVFARKTATVHALSGRDGGEESVSVKRARSTRKGRKKP